MENLNTATPIDSSLPPQNTTIQPSASRKPNSRLLFIVLSVLLISALIFTYLGYLVGKNNTVNPTLTIAATPIVMGEPTPIVILPTVIPTLVTNGLGVSDISFAENNGEVFLKHSINLNSSNVEFPNSKERSSTHVFTYDENLEPKEIKDIDFSKYNWVSVINKGVAESNGVSSVLISDRLFSFKKVPNTNNFVFVIDWERQATKDVGVWNPYESGRELYYYNQTKQPTLNKIATFENTTKSYNYPKLGSFSPDSRYVSLSLYGCWGCGGHIPETLIVDLQTLKTKNIGKMLNFEWLSNGKYTYKQYIPEKCSEEPNPGQCFKDPSTLPPQTGTF